MGMLVSGAGTMTRSAQRRLRRDVRRNRARGSSQDVSPRPERELHPSAARPFLRLGGVLAAAAWRRALPDRSVITAIGRRLASGAIAVIRLVRAAR